jgi:hypothetical protein
VTSDDLQPIPAGEVENEHGTAQPATPRWRVARVVIAAGAGLLLLAVFALRTEREPKPRPLPKPDLDASPHAVIWSLTGSARADYAVDYAADVRHPRETAAVLRSIRDVTGDGFGALQHSLPAESYRDKTFTFTAELEAVGIKGEARLWVRVDRPEGDTVELVHSQGTSGTSNAAARSVSVRVCTKCDRVHYGAFLHGTGTLVLTRPHVGPPQESAVRTTPSAEVRRIAHPVRGHSPPLVDGREVGYRPGNLWGSIGVGTRQQAH